MPLAWMKDEKIASVACSRETAVAFSEEGAIHIWGRKQKLLPTTDNKQQVVGTTPPLVRSSCFMYVRVMVMVMI